MGALKKTPRGADKTVKDKTSAPDQMTASVKKPRYRPDKDGVHRAQFDKNKKRILATQDICGICGKPVDKTLKAPHPMSAAIDHIIPVSKGGHPSDIDNLQLTHRCCNREKSDKLLQQKFSKEERRQEVLSNRVLPLTIDWLRYEPKP